MLVDNVVRSTDQLADEVSTLVLDVVRGSRREMRIQVGAIPDDVTLDGLMSVRTCDQLADVGGRIGGTRSHVHVGPIGPLRHSSVSSSSTTKT